MFLFETTTLVVQPFVSCFVMANGIRTKTFLSDLIRKYKQNTRI